ncbi:MAG: tetratricopeptide repeat protein, partial [Actinomycetota bacterium]|nr:tetratricopeptide repeat protein [Actinomycetota bacterium]
SYGDAARLYRRAIEAGRASGTEPARLAAVWEGLGLALGRTGEPRAAAQAFTVARRLFGDRAPLDEVRLLYRHARVAERSGTLTAAVCWVNRGLRALDRLEAPDAQAWRARLGSVLAGIRGVRQGRLQEAVGLCRLAIADAEATGELRALAHACYVLDHSLVQSGRPEEAIYSPRALEIYRRLGDPEQESRVLNNLGVFAHFEGHWDEAIDLYRQAAACSVRAGNAADAAYTDCNIGEILSDQGHLVEAAEHLRRAIRIWRSTGDEQGVAWVKLLLGRLEVRAARHADGVALLEQAWSELARMRLDADANLAQGLRAEAEVFGGETARALEITDGLLASPYRTTPLVRRVRGFAYQRLGRAGPAELEFTASLAAARELRSGYDIAAALDALEALGPSDPARALELAAMLERARIVNVPSPPAVSQPLLSAV